MLKKKPIRRNTIVRHKDGTFWGRVIRLLPNGKAFWLCCGYHFHISPLEDLVTGYKGTNCFYTGRFIHMTTLRNLKRRSRKFHHEFAHNTPLDYQFIRHE